MRSPFSLTLLFPLLFVLCIPVSALALEKVRFANVSKTNPLYSLPAIAAQEGGFWRQNGLEGEWFPFDAGIAMHQALASGSLDLGMSGAALTIQSISRGVPEIIVADIKSAEQFFFGVRRDSPIKGPGDLRGTRIGTSRFGSLTHTFGKVVAKRLGLEKEIKFAALGTTTSAVAALKAGRVDVNILGSLAMARLKFAGEVREVIAVRDYLPHPWMDLVMASRKELVTGKPELVARAVKAILQADSSILKNRQWAENKITAEFNFPRELARLMYEHITYSPDGKVNGQAVENVRSFLIEYSIVPEEKVPATEELFTDRFTG